MPKKNPSLLTINLLRPTCDPREFDFETTDDLPTLAGFVGQNRAIKAVQFGIGIKCEGFNIFALGPLGVGKRSIIRSLLDREAAKQDRPKDICYIHNFNDPRYPRVLFLPPGIGKKLAEDMRQLIDVLKLSIPAIFESKAYQTRTREIQEGTRKKQEEAFIILEKEAAQHNIAILRTAEGFVLAATKNGEIISDNDFAALPKEQKAQLDLLMKDLHGKLMSYLEQIPHWQKEQREKIKEAIKYFIMLEVGSVIGDVRKKYQSYPEIISYLKEVQQAILDNPIDFRKIKEGLSDVLGVGLPEPSFNRYRINVLVDNGEISGAPIVYENNPTFANLVGRIDHLSQFGALVTDFTLIRAGALHRANGGFLLLDALKLFSQPFAWEGLKRALRAKEVRVENIQQAIGFMGTISMEPEPTPLNLKVVLFGDRYVYYLLCVLDPEFLELFKVSADFNDQIGRTKENCFAFAQLIKNLLVKDQLKPLSKLAVAEMLDHSSRLTEDAKKISTHVQKLADLLREADHYATLENKQVIDHLDIEKAIVEQKYRASRFKEEQYEHIHRGRVLIDTDGETVGQINGLSYVLMGGFAFGYPMRITARVASGRSGVVDIEREVKLGGPIHSKGILILTGYLNGLFGKSHPLTLSASLVIEQSYVGIEGDSASVGEACALLSAIAEIPLKQSLGITGSINQRGQVQPIGGVNEKIEGFFDVCKEKGLSGEHGVIIPQANVENLMLRKDVTEATKRGQFSVYAVATVDEAMEILCGLKSGQRNKAGHFPKNSINDRVETALKQLAKNVSQSPVTKPKSK